MKKTILTNNTENISLFIFIVLCIFLLPFYITNWHNWGGDHAGYILQARSILDNTMHIAIQDVKWILDNSDYPVGPSAYPWGYPLFLAGAIFLFGESLYVLKGVGCVFFVGVLIVLVIFFRRRLTLLQSMCLISFFALNYSMLARLNHIFIDIPFFLFSTISILFLDNAQKNKDSYLLHISIFAVLAFCSTTIRSNGFLLICLLPIVQFISYFFEKQQVKKINYIVPYVIYVLLYFTYKNFFPSAGEGYLTFFKRISLESILTNLEFYSLLPHEFIPASKSFALVFYGISVVFFISGLVAKFRDEYMIIIYTAMTLLLYVLWPVHVGIRFVYPILPFYIYFCIIGIANLVQMKFARYIYGALICTLCISCLLCIKIVDNPTSSNEVGVYSDNAKEVFSFIAKHTDKNDVFVFFKPRLFYLETGRFAVWRYTAGDLDYDYILHYESKYKFPSLAELDKLVAEKKLSLVFNNDEFSLFKVLKNK